MVTVNVFEVPTVPPLYFAEMVMPLIADLITNDPVYDVPLSVIELGVMLPIEGVRVMTAPEGIFDAVSVVENEVPFETLGIVPKVICGVAVVEIVTLNDFETVVPFVPRQFTV